jgi:hypothetical protein
MDLAPLKTQFLFPCLHIKKGIDEYHHPWLVESVGGLMCIFFSWCTV